MFRPGPAGHERRHRASSIGRSALAGIAYPAYLANPSSGGMFRPGPAGHERRHRASSIGRSALAGIAYPSFPAYCNVKGTTPPIVAQAALAKRRWKDEPWQTHFGEQTGTAHLQYAQRRRSQQRHRCQTRLRPATYWSTGQQHLPAPRRQWNHRLHHQRRLPTSRQQRASRQNESRR